MYYHLTNVSSRRCTVTLTQIHTSKVKVTWDSVRCYKSRTHFPSFFSQNNLDIDLTYTTHNLNNKYPSITCLYIQEYLGYLSKNLYFLFSHSWQVALYNILVRFNVPVRLREKQNVLKKTTSRERETFLACLPYIYIYNISYTDYWQCIWVHIHGLCSYDLGTLTKGLNALKLNRGSNVCLNNVQYCRAHSWTLRNDDRHDITKKRVRIRRFTLL